MGGSPEIFKAGLLMRILYNSKLKKYKTPFGCLKKDEKCHLRIDIPKDCKTQKVSLYIFDEKGFSMTVPFKKETASGDYEIYKTTFLLFHVLCCAKWL